MAYSLFFFRDINNPYYGEKEYYTESEEIQIGRVRHRWAATYTFSFIFDFERSETSSRDNNMLYYGEGGERL